MTNPKSYLAHRVLFWILAALLGVLMLLGLWAGPAEAVTIGGGTEAQRAYILEVLENGPWPVYAVDRIYPGGVRIVLSDMGVYDWWDPPADGTAPPEWDGGSIVIGKAHFPGGLMELWSGLSPGYDQGLGEVVAHEWCHLFFYGTPYEFKQAWKAEATADVPGYNPAAWYEDPRENFAENAKLLWDLRYLAEDYARTGLKVWTPEETLAFIARHSSPVVAFTDVDQSDAELYWATLYLRDQGISRGYTDGTFGVGKPLLKRHIALMCARAGLPAPDWANNYSPATRGDVRDCIPGLAWDSERGDEPILRSQLARLIWRAR